MHQHLLRLRTASILLTGLLSACAGMGPESALFSGGQVNPAGANHMVEYKTPLIDSNILAAMICPEKVRRAEPQSKIDHFPEALQCFDTLVGAKPDAPQYLARRNSVQWYVITRSNQACALWVTYLERGGAINRGSFNVLSVLTGGAGAIVNGQAAQILSAASGAASGTGAAIDAAMLHGLAEGLIFPRVADARTQMLTKIEGHQGEDLAKYPMMRALSEAIEYHGLCNVSTALRADSPAARFGTEMELVADAAAKLTRAQAAFRGAAPAAAEDVKEGAMILVDNKVYKITAVDKDGKDAQITYELRTGDAPATPAKMAKTDFIAKMKGGLLLTPRKD